MLPHGESHRFQERTACPIGPTEFLARTREESTGVIGLQDGIQPPVDPHGGKKGLNSNGMTKPGLVVLAAAYLGHQHQGDAHCYFVL